MRWFGRRPELTAPEEPEDVVMIDAAGIEYAASPVYHRYDTDTGQHVWLVVAPAETAIQRVTIAKLPAKCTLLLVAETPPAGHDGSTNPPG